MEDDDDDHGRIGAALTTGAMNFRALLDEIRWMDRWPNHCRSCMAAGSHTHYESHGDPVGPPEPIEESCEDCLGNDQCPRCAGDWPGAADVEGPDACSHCGFNRLEPDARPARSQDPLGLEMDRVVMAAGLDAVGASPVDGINRRRRDEELEHVPRPAPGN